MIDLPEVTIILVLKVDSERRLKNARTVLGFLNHHFRTNVSIVELGPSRTGFISGLRNLEVSHVALDDECKFHRTRYINIALESVETPVVANHDIDVVLPPSSYVECRDAIVGGRSDVVYPYGYGKFQIQVPMSFNHSEFSRGGYETRSLVGETLPSKFGHCVFIGTDHYRDRGGENEGFVSFGPEDVERAKRFLSLGGRVVWLGGFVYHFEHPRGRDSGSKNADFRSNCDLARRILNMSRDSLFEYYGSAEYLRSYSKIRWNPQG